MCDNFPSLLVASQISRSNHNMVLTGSKQMVLDLAYIGYFHASHTQIYNYAVNLTIPPIWRGTASITILFASPA